MYDGYIIESEPMGDLYWQYVNLKYPDEPPEYHEASSKTIDGLNKQLTTINIFLRNILDDDDFNFSSFDKLIDYVLDNYPNDVDPDVLNIYLNSIETIVSLIGFKFKDDLKLIDCVGGVIISLE